MKSYHPYVFDLKRRKLVGRFEEMYQAEENQGFDSWHERDLRMLRKRLSREILSAYNFPRVLEIGCGKGAFTQWLKRENNRVVAVDISPTAVRRARETFPDVDFRVMDATQIAALDEKFDLVVVMAALAYIKGWRRLLAALSARTQYLYIAEYIPPKPIGCVKSGAQLLAALRRDYALRHHLVLDGEHHMILAQISSKKKTAR
jgi:SAM-dependent methyltransferase